MEIFVKSIFELIFTMIIRALGLENIDICSCIKCKCSCSIFIYLNFILIFYCIKLFLSLYSIRFISTQTKIYENNIKNFYHNLTDYNNKKNNDYNFNYFVKNKVYLINLIKYKYNEKIYLFLNFLIQFIFLCYLIYIIYLYKRKRNIFNYKIKNFPKKCILICTLNLIFSCIFNYKISKAIEIWLELFYYKNNNDYKNDLFIVYNNYHLINQVFIIFFSFINLFISIFFHCFIKYYFKENQINNYINNNYQIINIPIYQNNNNYIMNNIQNNQQNNNLYEKPISNINVNEPINQACPVPDLVQNVPIYNANILNTSLRSDNSQLNINN